ncbi:MAG: hypothetical protein F9K16_12095, partial [Thermoanaerobaculia bacterium]
MSEHRRETPGAFDHEIDRRGIVKTSIWLIAITLGSFVVAWLFYESLAATEKQRDPKPSPLVGAAAPVTPPGPLLQAAPENELAALRQREAARLEGWGWVDRGAGIAHVPVERAMDAVARDGVHR